MIRHEEECRREYREHMRDGQGTVELLHLIQNDGELNDKGRLFSKITLKPGCSIGNHMHEKDAELFYILKGCPEYSDNGTVVTLKPGDVTICPAGSSHS
ncbi:MAG: cupin domain-containing protein, partial [Solobacterium sp.]|nr:cupin domain-containing protein [Solobacterium sp.]